MTNLFESNNGIKENWLAPRKGFSVERLILIGSSPSTAPGVSPILVSRSRMPVLEQEGTFRATEDSMVTRLCINELETVWAPCAMEHIRLSRILGLLIALMVLATGCPPFGRGVDTEPDFTGRTTEIHPIARGGIVSQVLLGARVIRGDTEYLDEYIVTVKNDTLILEQDGGERRPGNFEAPAIGQQVQVWSSGPVRESYPAQVDAQQIVILK